MKESRSSHARLDDSRGAALAFIQKADSDNAHLFKAGNFAADCEPCFTLGMICQKWPHIPSSHEPFDSLFSSPWNPRPWSLLYRMSRSERISIPYKFFDLSYPLGIWVSVSRSQMKGTLGNQLARRAYQVVGIVDLFSQVKSCNYNVNVINIPANPGLERIGRMHQMVLSGVGLRKANIKWNTLWLPDLISPRMWKGIVL